MKKLSLFGKLMLPMLFLATFNNSCTDLDEKLYDTVTDDNFLKTEEEFISALGAAYTGLYALGNHGSYFSVQETSSDEAMIPTRGADWGDAHQWVNSHEHDFKPGDSNINNAWGFLYGGVATCNRLIAQFTTLKDAGKVTPALADKFIGELRTLRALYYYWLLDTFGNVPLVTSFDVPSDYKPKTETRLTIYNFVESELRDAVPALSKSNDGTTYGRMNYWAGKTIQAKLYLNAEVYSGTARWAEAAAAAGEIISSGLFSLETSYRTNFVNNNGYPNSKEFILAVPFDEVFAQGQNIAQMTLHYGSQLTYNLKEQPWNGYCSLQDFYNLHDDADSRKINFIVGPQFASDGVTPIIDGSVEAADPDGPQVNFTPEVNQIEPNALRQAGVRIGKYEFKSGASANLSNDMPLFRYADVLLTRAEALWRVNNGDAEALQLVNQVRDRSIKNAAFTSLNAQNLLDERGREMFYEGVRRQDEIRFGVYGNPTEFMPGSAKTKEIWPIPGPQINVNPNLVQNPGY